MGKTSASKKIKSHLRTKGRRKTKPTKARVLYWHKLINEAVFDGELKTPEVTIKGMKNDLGQCIVNHVVDSKTERRVDPLDDGSVTIIISNAKMDRETLISTVAHEAVHQWQWETSKEGNHAEKFKEWVNWFYENYNIKL